MTDGWAHVDREQVHSDWDLLYRSLATVCDEQEAGSAAVQELIGQHYAIASRFYVPSKEAYIGMSLFYAENLEMRAFHDQYGLRLVDFLPEAMRLFAERSL